ncbi:hypothetical protein F0562_006305 [Nyssa sinensis]|uniref:ACB domain-containing protein n=1 Tax=Nyssa sinensis TaxID=561372 RepID=A0A5J5APE3_9ASTE|nr:hypothetical protein F0562_006305 [Nyssa sinensis]
MELFQALLFTVVLPLLVSFLLAKLFSLPSACAVPEDKSVSVSVTDVIEKAVMHQPKYDKESAVCDSESQRRVKLIEEAVECNEVVEEEFRVEAIGSRVICDDNEMGDNGQVSGEVGIEGKSAENSVGDEVKEGRFDSGELREEKVFVGRDDFEENLVGESSERGEIEIESKNLVEETLDRVKFREIEIELVKDEMSVATTEEVGILGSDGNKENECDVVSEIEIELVKDEATVAKTKDIGDLESEGSKDNDSDGLNNNADAAAADDDDEEVLYDDWEGIERTELEKRFGAAMVFVGSKSNADRISNLGNDTKMQLYGLHRVAVDGTCSEPQPMALKVSARAKWNAWQRLGNMSRDMAMEQYVTLLSRSIPGWMEDDTGGDERVFSDAEASGDLPSNLHKQPGAENERKSEASKPCAEECGKIVVEDPNSINRVALHDHAASP